MSWMNEDATQSVSWVRPPVWAEVVQRLVEDIAPDLKGWVCKWSNNGNERSMSLVDGTIIAKELKKVKLSRVSIAKN